MNTLIRTSGRLAAVALCATIVAPTFAATPTPDELIAKAIKAMGGQKAIDSIETLHVAFERTAPMGTMTGEVFWGKPNRVLVKRTIPRMGEMVMGTDGKIGWINHPMMGYQLMGPEELEQIHDQVIHMRILRLKQTIEENEHQFADVLESEFDGKKAYELKILEKEDGEQRDSTIYFGADSGLVLGMRIIEGERPPSVVHIKDWTTIGGVKFFTSMTVSEDASSNMSMTFSEVSVNDTEPDVFKVPEEVKKLVADEAAAPPISEMSIEDFSPPVQPRVRSMIRNMPDDLDGLKIYRGQLESRLGQMPGEMKKGMEYVIYKIDDKIAALGG